jgi:hypothetical protein
LFKLYICIFQQKPYLQMKNNRTTMNNVIAKIILLLDTMLKVAHWPTTIIIHHPALFISLAGQVQVHTLAILSLHFDIQMFLAILSLHSNIQMFLSILSLHSNIQMFLAILSLHSNIHKFIAILSLHSRLKYRCF